MNKRMKLLTVGSALLAGIFLVSGCRAILVPADEEIEPGERETRNYDLTGFTGVDIDGAFGYEIVQADNWSISITTGSNLFEYIRVTSSGQVLDIRVKVPGGLFWSSNTYTRPQAVITMPELRSLESSGATDGTVTGFSSGGNLDISIDGACKLELADITAGMAVMELSGASRISGDIQAVSLELDVDSASRVSLEGSTDYLAADASGASKADLPEFITRDADIILSGASKATINLSGKLDVNISGASTLEYYGEPEIGVLDVSGASTLRKK